MNLKHHIFSIDVQPFSYFDVTHWKVNFCSMVFENVPEGNKTGKVNQFWTVDVTHTLCWLLDIHIAPRLLPFLYLFLHIACLSFVLLRNIIQ